MENHSYAASYPESGDSSPRTREIDFDNTTPWEDQQPSSNYKLKLMCSYGGKINPRPHDNLLSYVGGETKILVVDRNIKFFGLIAKLCSLSDAHVCFKYQLPGEDLDALISVANDDDLEHMMHEYDQLYRASSKPARLRLFLFPGAVSSPGSCGSGEEKRERERFVDALNSGPVQSSPPPSTVKPANNVDFLFGLDNGMLAKQQPQQTVPTKVLDPTPAQQVPAPIQHDRVMDAALIQRQIDDLQRLHISAKEQNIYRRNSDENLVGGFAGEYYGQNFPVSPPPAYWPENQVTGRVYPPNAHGLEHQVYMIPAQTGVYHAPMGRQVTGPAGQGYYAIQRMPPEAYRDQHSVYNVVQSAPATAPPKMAGYAEGIGMVRPTTGVGVGVVDTGYGQVAYDSGAAGMQVYYTAAPGVVAPTPQTYPVSATVSPDMIPGGGLGQEGKVVVKASQASA